MSQEELLYAIDYLTLNQRFPKKNLKPKDLILIKMLLVN